MLPRSRQGRATVLQPNAQDPQQPKSAWEYYLDMTRIEDTEREREVTEQVDTQLVFAGLFAAFLSAFLIETLGRLEEDPTATLLDVMVYQTQMMRNETLPPYHREPFTPSPRIVAANMLFLASLTLTLVVAFISMLVKEWIREFDRGLAAIVKPRRRALVREYRFAGLERWKFLEVVHFLPVLIYFSLFLFFCGLSLFLLDIEAACSFIVAAIFALGVLFYATTTAIAALCDSAPFRSPLSRALGQQFRRLHSMLLGGSTLWQSCLIQVANTDYPRSIRALFYHVARITRWEPYSEAYFCNGDGDLIWDEQHINVSEAVLNRLYTSLPDDGTLRELYRSIVLAGDPAHVLDFARTSRLLWRSAHSSDAVTPEAARAVGLLICRTDAHVRAYLGRYLDSSLPYLTRSSQPWDRLLACLIQSPLYEYRAGAPSPPLNHAHILEAMHMISCTPKLVLLIVRFLARIVPHNAGPERKAAVVRILSALLSRLLHPRYSFSSDQCVHVVLYAFVAINDVPLPDIYLHSSLSEYPSLPYLPYNPGVLSQVLNPTQWCKRGTSVLPACREFARTLLEWLWYQVASSQLDARILHELPLSQLEDNVLDSTRDLQENLILASLLLEALISASGSPRSDFPLLNKEHPDLAEVLTLYDAYLIQCSAMPSPAMQNLLSVTDHGIRPFRLDIKIRHPWLALHTSTLRRRMIPPELVPALRWTDTPALDMIARGRLELYERSWVPPEPSLVALFLSSGTYETVLRAFTWHIKLLTDPRLQQDTVLARTPDLERLVALFFGAHRDAAQVESSWMLLLDWVIPSWSSSPAKLKRGFAREFFKCERGVQIATTRDPNTCVGIAWAERLWSAVLISFASAVYIEEECMAQDPALFEKNTGWSGPVEIEPEDEIRKLSMKKRIRRQKIEWEQERARRSNLVSSVDQVLPVLAALLETAHGAGVLSINAVAHLRASPLLSHPRLCQDAGSVKIIDTILEYYRPHLHPLPACTPHETEILSVGHAM